MRGHAKYWILAILPFSTTFSCGTTKNFTCFKTYSKLDAAKEKTLFAYKNLRNVKRSDPKDCKLILNETYNYSFYKKKISVGTAWFCNYN